MAPKSVAADNQVVMDNDLLYGADCEYLRCFKMEHIDENSNFHQSDTLCFHQSVHEISK
jgi:hypothetical protein